MIKVLVVDDSALVRKLFGAAFASQADLEVRFARNGLEAMSELEAFRPNVITLDVHMPSMNGLECLDRIMIERPCPVVMVSSLTADGADATLEALRLGAVDFISKPGGAVSMHMDAFAPTLIEKVRAAAAVRLRASTRLKERVKHRARGVSLKQRSLAPFAHPLPDVVIEAASGEGLVLVGTSTGGPPALEALLIPLRADFPWPIVIAQHMPAGFTGPLAKRLNNLCAIDVVEITKPTLLTPGCAYIAKGDADVVISRRPAGLFAMSAPSHADYPWHPSTNRLVTSAMAYVDPAHLIGVLMTGMGNDGAAAMARLHSQGGKTIAESEETAIIWGMPGELVKAGGANWVLPLPHIAERLQQLLPRHAADS